MLSGCPIVPSHDVLFSARPHRPRMQLRAADLLLHRLLLLFFFSFSFSSFSFSSFCLHPLLLCFFFLIQFLPHLYLCFPSFLPAPLYYPSYCHPYYHCLSSLATSLTVVDYVLLLPPCLLLLSRQSRLVPIRPSRSKCSTMAILAASRYFSEI